MKKETIVKVLKRYAAGLQSMENEARMQNELKDVEHYKFDKQVMYEAIKLVESRKEKYRILVD